MRSTAGVCLPVRGIGGAGAPSLCCLTVTLLLAIAVSLTGVGSAAAKRVVIGASPTAILIWIARERGYFREQGLDVEVRRFQSGLEALNAVASRDADLGTTSETPLVDSSFENPDLRVLATISASETLRLIARGDREINQPNDLKGKRIGVTLGTTGEYFLARYMILNGISPTAATMVDLMPEAIAAQLVKGDIDAGLTWEPFIRNAEIALDKNLVIPPRQFDQMYNFMLVSTQAWLDENPADARAILRAIIQAERYARESRDDAKELVRKLFDIPVDYIDHLWSLHNLHVSLPQVLVIVLERQAEWRSRTKPANRQKMPDYLRFIATEPLREIRESSVGIVK